jgi:hypothetical protein
MELVVSRRFHEQTGYMVFCSGGGGLVSAHVRTADGISETTACVRAGGNALLSEVTVLTANSRRD